MRYVFSDQKTYYSPVGVDKIIDEVYFPDQKTGNCIEVGAVDGMDGSNTLYFERRNGKWKLTQFEDLSD